MYLNSMAADDNIEERLDDLDDLIRYLESEKDRLKNCVKEAAKEWEFSTAKAFAKAHNKIERRLHVLRNLKDPSYDERAGLYRTLVFLEEQMEDSDAPQIIQHLTERLKETNQALDKFENATYSPIDTQHVDDAIFLLVDGSIEAFKLHLNKSEELVFDFTFADNRLHIGFSYKKGALYSTKKKGLRKIGFTKVDGLRRLVHSIDVSNFKDAQKIKQLLAVVVFDVFGRGWFDNPAELEIDYRSDPSSAETE